MINQLNYMYMHKLRSTREAGTSITVSENGTYKYLLLQYAKWSTEAGTFRSVVFVNPVHGWLVAALSTLMISMFYRSRNQFIYIYRHNDVNIMTSVK